MLLQKEAPFDCSEPGRWIGNELVCFKEQTQPWCFARLMASFDLENVRFFAASIPFFLCGYFEFMSFFLQASWTRSMQCYLRKVNGRRSIRDWKQLR